MRQTREAWLPGDSIPRLGRTPHPFAALDKWLPVHQPCWADHPAHPTPKTLLTPQAMGPEGLLQRKSLSLETRDFSEDVLALGQLWRTCCLKVKGLIVNVKAELSNRWSVCVGIPPAPLKGQQMCSVCGREFYVSEQSQEWVRLKGKARPVNVPSSRG